MDGALPAWMGHGVTAGRTEMSVDPAAALPDPAAGHRDVQSTPGLDTCRGSPVKHSHTAAQQSGSRD